MAQRVDPEGVGCRIKAKRVHDFDDKICPHIYA